MSDPVLANGGATVASLSAELALSEAKCGALVQKVVGLEDELANHDLKEFAAVIKPDSLADVRSQLIENREGTLGLLRGLVPPAKVVSPVVPTPAPIHNRATARPVVPAAVGGGGVAPDTEGRAAKIRNRAREISKTERVAFSIAFRRAEAEVSGQ